MKLKIELVELNGRPAIQFEDGDILFQNEPISTFLMHLDTLSNGTLKDEFVVEIP